MIIITLDWKCRGKRTKSTQNSVNVVVWRYW